MNVVVTGGRDFNDRWRVWDTLGKLSPRRVAQGGARGADTWSRRWAQFYRRDSVTYAADWSAGRSAGPIRNRAMLDAEKPYAVVSFPGGPGTRDCLRAARERKLLVLVG